MTAHHPEISIVTPVYNTNPLFIQELKEAILQQTFPDFQWLLVDDGSDDPAVKDYLQQLSKTDPRFRYINHPSNKGLPAARNTGIQHSSGPFIFFIDADDLLEPTTLEKLYVTLQCNPSFQFANTYVKGFGDKHYSWTGGFHDGAVFMKENRNTSCFMGRAEVVKALLFDETLTQGGEDWDFWLHAASKGHWGHTIPEYLFHYRIIKKQGKWNAIDSRQKIIETGEQLRMKYGGELNKNGFPSRSFPPYVFGEAHSPLPEQKEKEAASQAILFLLPWLEMGGADKFNLDLARGLREKGWKIYIACTAHSSHEWLPEFGKVTKDIFLLPNYSSEYDYYRVLTYLIHSRNIKIIFLSHTLYGYNCLPYLRQKFPEVPVVDYIHCEDESWYSGGYPMFSAVYTRLLSRTLTTSSHLKDWCVQRGGDAHKTEVVYINIDIHAVKRDPVKRSAIRKELGINDKTPLIIYVARLTPQKQPEVLIDSLTRLYESEKNFKCVIIGDGPEKENLRVKLRKSPAAGKIHYLKSLPNEKVMEYMDAADIFFLPSFFEGIALAIYEAMAKELAIVGANVGGQHELVDKHNGVLIHRSTPVREVKEYSKTLQHFITHLSETRAMGKAGREKVEAHFDIQLMLDRMDQVLKQVMEEHVPHIVTAADESLVLLNRLLYVEKENKVMAEATKSTLKRLLAKYPGKTATAKKIFHTIKTNLKKK